MKYLLIALALLLPLVAHAQAKQGLARIDSIKSTLPGRVEDTLHVRALNTISNSYRGFNLDSSELYGRRMLAMARKIGFQRGEALSNNRIGDAVSNAHRWAEALPYYLEAARIYEVMGDELGMAGSYTNASEVYTATKQGQKAYEYASRGVGKMLKYGGTQEWLVYGYMDLGAATALLGKQAEAERYLLKSDSVAQLTGDPKLISPASYFLGNHYREIKAYDRALAAFVRCLNMGRAVGMRQYEGMMLAKIGIVYKEMADQPVLPKPDSLIPATRAAIRQKAIAYIEEGIKINGTSKIPASELRSLYANYAALLEEKGSFKEAAQAYRLASDLGDTIAKAADGERIARYENKQAMEIKDKDLQIAGLEVAKKKNAQWFFIAGLGLLLGIAGLLLRGFRIQKKGNLLLTREKKRSDDLLLNILPEEVAEELKAGGTSAARQFDEVSVLFTDFVNFTEASERLSPKELVAELHACFSAFDNIIGRHGLEKIKTIGDAYMAVSGLPVADEKHACHCVQAALDIREFILARSESGGPFQIRIGINSGPVVAGIVGIKKFAYDIWGDTVNTAARMEQHGEAGEVNVSQTTYELIKDDFSCQERGKITAKHKGDIEMYFVQTKISTLAA